MIDLRPLRREAHPLFERFLAETGAPLSAYSLISHHLWQDHFSFQWAVYQEHLLLFATYDRCVYMPLPPLGFPDRQVVLDCFEWMDRKNPTRSISRIENIPEAECSFYRECGLTVEPKAPEYLYRRQALSDLKGDRYKSPRAACNQFQKRYNPVDRPYRSSDGAGATSLFEKWARERTERNLDPVYRQMLCDAEPVHRRAFVEAEALGLVGRVIEVSGELVGYTLGFPLDRETFCIFLEATHPEFKGASAFLFRAFCRTLIPYTWINAMDDSGIPSLRRTKESYHPERKLICALARR
ncbi:MAG: phosphatidylglycerol lysyltransferase domain-containing protein [Candidatus Manganitrophaceae bacterium]